MRRYRHLSAEERDRIAEMHARHEGVSAIAAAIGRNKSTVSREIARNGRNGRYGAIAAQSRSDARRKACRPRKRLSDPAPAAEVRRRIVDDRRSPEQIDGRSRLERGGRCVVSFSTIYRAVNAGEPDPPQAAPEEGVRGRLRRRGRRPRRGREETRCRIKVDHEVSERPREADARSRLGDREDDAVVGPAPACPVTMTDRASRPLVGGRARAHSSAEVAKVEVRALAGRPLETVTPDRGKEFANHREVSRALGGVPFYFCQPHHPWQKPTVENTNGPIREFFPKGTDFSRVTDEEVQEVFEKINDRPRKVLGFRTANEVYREIAAGLQDRVVDVLDDVTHDHLVLAVGLDDLDDALEGLDLGRVGAGLVLELEAHARDAVRDAGDVLGAAYVLEYGSGQVVVFFCHYSLLSDIARAASPGRLRWWRWPVDTSRSSSCACARACRCPGCRGPRR